MDAVDLDKILGEEPEWLHGDPVLRTLVGLVDSGEARRVQVVINFAGQMISGTLISAGDYAAMADDLVSAWGMEEDALFLMRQTLLLAAPYEVDEDPWGFKQANYVHVLRPDLMPGGNGESQLWRSPIEAVTSWSI